MFRSVVTLALSLFLVAEARAQTTPVAPTKTTAKSAKALARTDRRAARKARRLARKSMPATPRVNDGWPALEDSQSAVAATAPFDAVAYGAPAASSRGEIDNANVYAAPGMPVHVRTSKGMVPYSVRPARKPAGPQTTLTPGN
ncbi:hypothetical protein IC235_03825 [Hymenobacter sp. BT664]|uniref:Uncharacterized protein n=1 Tax=Hymenobacter montanus TaxID=2771359 RepID=A0A927GIF5_9BACT|nr:hypothetical protein [Hymenobacter montanus]MBD2767021.1 hypothetical protein [Hymenobacter montanus]